VTTKNPQSARGLTIEYQKDLTFLHTMACQAVAEHYIAVRTLQQLQEALQYGVDHKCDVFVLGGGSNVLFPPVKRGLVIHILNQGIVVRNHAAEIAEKTSSQQCQFVVSAGEIWHDFVLWTLEQGYRGLENLSLIPGSVGAAPIQNIGAYGVEVAQRLQSVRAIHKVTLQDRVFSRKQCQFGYRDSIFKHSARDWIIWEVTFNLSSSAPLVTDYSELNELWQTRQCPDDALVISQLICEIRRRKLPDPHLLPNSGSFFKNPILSPDHFRGLLAQFPDLVNYPQPDGNYKLAAGWLIEQAGWKGYEKEGVGVCTTQALVLTNKGRLGAQNILKLAQDVQLSVFKMFGIELEIEPVLA